MNLSTIADVKMVGKALRRGWLQGNEEKLQAAVDALFQVVQGDDAEMRIKAFTALVNADKADLKREEIAVRKQAADDAKRLRLLELLKQLPPGVIAEIASGDKGSTGG